MNTLMSLVWSVLPLVSACQGKEAADFLAKEKARLESTWGVVSAKWFGEPIDMSWKKEKTWDFARGRFRAFIGSPEGETGEYRIDPTRTPKHLDLIPSEGKDRTPRKCIYSLEGDELKIAFTLWFVPGTPEEEAKQAKKMKAIRPERFDTGAGKADPVMVLTLKRQKKK